MHVYHTHIYIHHFFFLSRWYSGAISALCSRINPGSAWRAIVVLRIKPRSASRKATACLLYYLSSARKKIAFSDGSLQLDVNCVFGARSSMPLSLYWLHWDKALILISKSGIYVSRKGNTGYRNTQKLSNKSRSAQKMGAYALCVETLKGSG